MKFKLIITNLTGGGAEKVILTLAVELMKQEHDVEIVLLQNLIQHEVPNGIKITVLMQKPSRSWIGKRYVANRLKKHIKSQEKPDLIISALPFANEISYLANLPNHWCRIDNTLGIEIDKLAVKNPKKAKRRLNRYRRIYNNRPLIAISNGMIDDLKNIGITGKIVKIANPLDFADIKCKSDEYSVDETDYIIHVGRFNTQKRHDILINAYKVSCIKQKLVLLGDHTTPQGQKIRKLVYGLGIEDKVIFMGFKPNPYPYIKNAKALMLSSDHEGLGMVLIEALILGVPVVSTDCPSGPSEILVNELSEFLSPVGDVEALSINIRKMLKAPVKITDDYISKFDAGKIAKQYLALCKND
ncbi:glycosyltransferase [Candidatus Spongiihabitans sp.]|uniref:glycosyltransferase n=1 Tax=Candidatus Spongiihabitans sp. TaxID=3101308 RepID=UPI003C705BF1